MFRSPLVSDQKQFVWNNTVHLSVVFLRVCMFFFFLLFLLLAWPLFVTYCVHLHAYVLPSSEVRLSKQSVSPSTLSVTHGLFSLQRVTCFSISSALKNTLMSRCSCALSVHSSSWAGSVVCQHHANVVSVKAVDQIELNGVSSRALRSHCTRLLNSCLSPNPCFPHCCNSTRWLDVLFKAKSMFLKTFLCPYGKKVSRCQRSEASTNSNHFKGFIYFLFYFEK